MSLIAIALLVVSALLHALWNGVLRQATDKYVAMWWGLVVGSLLFLPLLVFTAPLPIDGWKYVLPSAALEALYFGILVTAYRNGDFSVVYPIARGTAPGLLAVWAILFLGERPSPVALLGISVLVLGLVLVGLQRQNRLVPFAYKSLALPLMVAVIISLYSVVDGAAVQQLPAVSYTIWVFLSTVLLLTPFIWKHYGGRTLWQAWRANPLVLCLTGGAMIGAYILVLLAYQLAPVSYGGAIREMSVVFAAGLGRFWFKEQVGVYRLLGICLIFGGVLLIAGG